MKRQKKMPKIPIMWRLPLFLLLTLFWCQSAQGAEEEGAMISGPGFDKLDLSELRKSILSEGDTRGGRQQFQDAASAGGVGGVGGGGNEVVGVGLIDALQRWADALEAQITMMRTEMSDMRRDNRRLRDESQRAAQESAEARRELEQVRTELMENQGEMTRLTGGADAKLEALRGDLRTFSGSFSDFLGHYDKTMRQVRTNHSVVQGQLDWTKDSVKDLSSTLGGQDVGGMRLSLEDLSDRVQVLAQADYILEERVRHAENRTDGLAATLNKEVMKLRNGMVSPSALREAVAEVSEEVEEVRTEAGVNVTAVSFTVKALQQTLRASIDDVTKTLSSHDQRTDRLTEEVRVQARAFAEDFANFQKSIDFAKGKYDELTGATDGLRARLKEHALLRQNLTQALLKAMNEMGGRIEENDARLDRVEPEVEELKDSLNTFVGQVGAEVIKLHTADEELNLRMEDVEAMVGISNGGDGADVVSRNSNSSSSNSGSSLTDRVTSLEQGLSGLRGNEIPVLFSTLGESRSNHSRLANGLSALEKHLVDARREDFERGLRVQEMNDTLRDLGETSRGLLRASERLSEASSELGASVRDLRAGQEELAGEAERARRERAAVAAATNRAEEALREHAGKNKERQDGLAEAIARLDNRTKNETLALETGLGRLANFSSALKANLTRVLVFAAANKAELLELKVVGNTVEDKLDRLYLLHQTQADAAAEAGGHAAANMTRLRGAAAALERDVDAMAERFRSLEQLLSDHASSAGETEAAVGALRAAQAEAAAALGAIRADVDSARAAQGGADSLVAAVQGSVAALTANVTRVARNLTRLREVEVRDLRERAEEASEERKAVAATVAENRRGLERADEQLQVLRSSSSTLKANIVGLGNYINNINGDVGKLASTFEKYIGQLTADMDSVKGNVTALEASLEDTSSSLRASLAAQEAAATAAKNDVSALTAKTYEAKTSAFEQRNELSALAARTGTLESRLAGTAKDGEARTKELAAMRGDVSALRSGLTSLTNSMFSLKQQQQQDKDKIQQQGLDGAAAKELRDKVDRVAGDVTAVGREVSRLRRDYSTAGAEVKALSGDVSSFKSRFTSVTKQLSSVSDPPRFSCAVTSDEIRTSGVITYNICNVNTDGLMDRETGHVTVKQAGDYFVSFTGNMVSVSAQAVWCALYKQSAGNEGWQVLGMINNYQRNGDNLDDRDSGSLSTITSLREGDQIWVEWRGYGDSFLYSNPYRLISFTGFLLKPSS